MDTRRPLPCSIASLLIVPSSHCDLTMSACIDIIGCDIAKTFMIARVVVVLDEQLDSFLQFTGHPIGH